MLASNDTGLLSLVAIYTQWGFNIWSGCIFFGHLKRLNDPAIIIFTLTHLSRRDNRVIGLVKVKPPNACSCLLWWNQMYLLLCMCDFLKFVTEKPISSKNCPNDVSKVILVWAWSLGGFMMVSTASLSLCASVGLFLNKCIWMHSDTAVVLCIEGNTL